MKERCEIEEKYKWDLTRFFADDKAFFDYLDGLSKEIDKVKTYEGKLSNDDVLFEYLEYQTDLMRKVEKGCYAFLRQCEDGSSRIANEMTEKRSIVLTKLEKALTAVDIEIDKFSIAKLKRLKDEKRFANYKRFFETTIRHKKHTLSKSEELLLSSMGEFMGGYSDNFDKFSDVDLKFDAIEDKNGKKHEFSHSKYSIYTCSNDRTLRKNAFKEMNGKYGEYINFLASNYINEVKENCVIAKVKKYKSALDCAIYCEEASEDVYNMLIKKVRENVGVQAEYFEIKRKMLGLDKFAIYDTFAPIENEKEEKKYTYDEAIELIKEAVSVLGDEYVSLIDKAKDERWIDVYPNKNKYSGAFCGGCGDTPVVLTNFEGNLESVFTLAHELGHAMHTYYSNKHQPFQTEDYVIYVAEVASTTNEMLLLNLLLKKAKTVKERISLYDKFLREVRSCIFRQTMFAEFEEFAHSEYEKENPLTADLLCDEYKKLNDFYHGEKVEQIPEMKYEWARIPHFYTAFYVYKYATGLICAIKISSRLLKDRKFAEKYLKFLSSGCSADPISLLKIADCDLTKEETFDEAFETCKEFIRKWESEI